MLYLGQNREKVLLKKSGKRSGSVAKKVREDLCSGEQNEVRQEMVEGGEPIGVPYVLI